MMITINLYDESLRCLLCFEKLSEVWVSDQVLIKLVFKSVKLALLG